MNIALVHHGTVLLTRREDFDVWCLPGGAVATGETAVEAARREMREETGYEVEPEALVGIYYQSNGFHTCVFRARRVGGTSAADPAEVTEMRRFTLESLPADIMWWYELRIRRALAGAVGEVWYQDVGGAAARLPRRELYALRDSVPGSRSAFYREHLTPRGPRGEERHL